MLQAFCSFLPICSFPSGYNFPFIFKQGAVSAEFSIAPLENSRLQFKIQPDRRFVRNGMHDPRINILHLANPENVILLSWQCHGRRDTDKVTFRPQEAGLSFNFRYVMTIDRNAVLVPRVNNDNATAGPAQCDRRSSAFS